MANLTDANSNKNNFQVHGSHYKYEKGVPLGLPIFRSIFKTLLQNTEGKFIKGSSKSKVIILRDVQEDTIHLTYLFHPTCVVCMRQIPVGMPSWSSSQSFMHHHILCDLFHGIHGVQEMQVSVMMTHNVELVHRLLSGVLKLGLHGHHGIIQVPHLTEITENNCLKKFQTIRLLVIKYKSNNHKISHINPLNPELNPICYLLALLGAHHFLHVSRIRVKLLTFRLLMSYIYGAPILDVSRSHTTTQHSR